MIHGFCYAEMTLEKDSSLIDEKTKSYLERENKCAALWHSRVKAFSENEALVIIPWFGKRNGPVWNFNAFADSLLGDRCFILDSVDGFNPAFWSKSDTDFHTAVLGELESALVGQKDAWNKEELLTALHSLACCRQLNKLLHDRGCSFDREKVHIEGWGASFDGCVTKYTLHIRRVLGISKPIQIKYEMTVPDAFFLLDASIAESILLNDGLRLFIFKKGNQKIACYTMTQQSLGDKPRFVQLDFGLGKVTVMSKQGIRLWPQPEEYHLPSAPIGCYEPPQKVVRLENNGLFVPVTAGYVYRLAKAPAYIFAAADMSCDDFRNILLQAKLVQ